MLLGIDASRALSAAPTGTEYYSRALIQALLRRPFAFRYRLYTRSPPPPNLFPVTGNYEIRSIPLPRLWSHLRLSYEMLTQPPDALFVPAHVLPPIHPARSLVTVHDLGYKYFPDAYRPFARAYLELSTRWNARAARVVIADSEATRRDLVQFYGVPPEKIRVVYPAYNAEIFQPARDPAHLAAVLRRYQVNSPYLLAVGTVQPRKNYTRLLEAFAALPTAYSLVIIGKKGWLYEPIFQHLSALNLQSRVKFLDYIPLADLPALYAGARATVLASLYEGFGLPALEAQACASPLACSNTSSLPEVAGMGAAYFDPFDVGEMTRVIAAVLTDDAARANLIQRGQENIRRFSWEQAAQQVAGIVSAL